MERGELVKIPRLAGFYLEKFNLSEKDCRNDGGRSNKLSSVSDGKYAEEVGISERVRHFSCCNNQVYFIEERKVLPEKKVLSMSFVRWLTFYNRNSNAQTKPYEKAIERTSK